MGSPTPRPGPASPQVGPNVLRVFKPRPARTILLDQLRSVVVLLLVAAAGIALVTGDVLDAAAIGAVLVINTTLGFITELRARREMESMLRLQAPKAVVVRDVTHERSRRANSCPAT